MTASRACLHPQAPATQVVPPTRRRPENHRSHDQDKQQHHAGPLDPAQKEGVQACSARKPMFAVSTSAGPNDFANCGAERGQSHHDGNLLVSPRAREHPPVIRISAALILLASVVQAPPAWVATAGLCVFTISLESWDLIEP
jgi:hypothetical protein